MPAVKGYTYKRNGKTIRVEGHLRKRGKTQRGGVGVPLGNVGTPIDRVKAPIDKVTWRI